jgi:hypothetical protein
LPHWDTAIPDRLPGSADPNRHTWRASISITLSECGWSTSAGHRLVLDHPDAVTRFAVLDIVPTQYALRHLTLTSVMLNYQWFFLSTGRGIPEHMIAADPGLWVREQTAQLIGAGTTRPAARQPPPEAVLDPLV